MSERKFASRAEQRRFEMNKPKFPDVGRIKRMRLEDRRDIKDEYSEPGIAIGAELSGVGFVSIASVVYGCEEAKALGDQMEIARRLVACWNYCEAKGLTTAELETA